MRLRLREPTAAKQRGPVVQRRVHGDLGSHAAVLHLRHLVYLFLDFEGL